MKKGRMLAGVLAASLMLMGAGFAAWTQGFTVTSIADTGELRVEVKNLGKDSNINDIVVIDKNGNPVHSHTMHQGDPELINGELVFEPSNGTDLEHFSVKMVLDEGKEKLSTIVSKAYPGIVLDYDLTLENLSTMPVRVNIQNPITFTGAGTNKELADLLLEQGYIEVICDPIYADQDVLNVQGHSGDELTLDIVLRIKHSLPDFVEITEAGGVKRIPVERQELQYDIEFNFTQAVN